MESLFLFVLGVSAPLAVAVTLLALEERQRARLRAYLERASQYNRGMQLTSSTTAAKSLPTGTNRREVDQLLEKLARNGILMDWLRLGADEPAEARARLAGTGGDGGALQQAVAEWGAHGIVAALDRLKGRLAAIAEMKMIWADPHAHIDRDPGDMLERTMWVFEPEYVVSEGRFAVDPQLGALAKPLIGASLTPAQHKDGEPTLVVELKSARVTVGADQQLQAWNNVRELMRGGAVREGDPVEVFVVGGAVDELDGNPRIEGRHRNVRITSYDYRQLVARANRLTFGLYEELKDSAPFLRRHREEIATEQQAAMDRAASEVVAQPGDRADAARHAETIHAHEPTDRSGHYEGEHIVIGKRRYAAQ